MSFCDCKQDYRISYEEGYYFCPVCKAVGNEIYINQLPYEENFNNIRQSRSIYKRKTYFKQKLKELTEINILHINDIDNIINYLKTFDFSTTTELKEILKLSKLRHLYKHIYALYYHVKGTKLFYLNNNDIDKLYNHFLKFEDKYKKNKNRNLTGYNIYLYKTLRDMGYDCYRHIILPNKIHKEMKKMLC